VQLINKRSLTESLLDRARENTLFLIEQNRRIVTATESGTQPNWSVEEVIRLRMLTTEHEALLERYSTER
jgi:hypothetical protein